MRRFSSPILRRAWIPYFILIFTLVLSLLTMVFTGEETSENDSLRFTNIVERTQGTISNQMYTYITLLEGASGLHAASDEVTRAEFKTYVDRLNLRARYPGIQGIGFLRKIPRAEKDGLIEQIRAEGEQDFTIWPDEGQADLMPIVYIEPLDRRNRAALGYDMHTDPVRGKAMDRAAQTALPALSGKVRLVQEVDQNKQAGFLIYLPIYREGLIPEEEGERIRNLEGFIYSPFRGDDLFRGILKGEKSPQIDFRVYDGEAKPENLLHDSRSFANTRDSLYRPRFTRNEKLEIAGRTWTIQYFSNQAFDAASDTLLVPFALIFGLIVSGVLFILSRAQYEAGRKAEISESNLHYIAEAGKVLASSFDYKKTISIVANLAVPHLADWCSVDLRNGSEIVSLVVAHKNEKKSKLVEEYRKLHPPSLKDTRGVGKVLTTGKTEYFPVITERMLKASISKEEFARVKSIGLSSAIVVPLKIHRKVIGAMTFISSTPKRQYTRTDVSVAEEIAHRAALAIEHARLFSESQEAVEIRDEFISVASHELKTPVTSLKMYLQVLHKQLTKNGDTILANAVLKMDTQVDKLTLLISDLLNVSRIKHGRLEFHDELFDLNEAVAEVVENVQTTTKHHKITIGGRVKKKVFGDRDRIGQVLTNLLTNAIKYSPDSKRIEVTLTEDAKKATVSVRDYGIGIEAKHVGKIFTRFYRVSAPNERTFPGLGIGLFISGEIIKRHNGMISVSSKKGEGSVFSFTLPIRSKK